MKIPNNPASLRVIPLGGLGEIGKNMNALEYGDDIIVLDLGSKFATAAEPGVDMILPDTRYLERNKHKLRGVVITHGHMDHIGGAGAFLARYAVPVYGSRFTIAMIEKQLEEVALPTKSQLRVIDPDSHERVQIGAFSVELVRVGHSIPDPTAIVVRTPVGLVIDTGDWRFQPDPIIGKPMDLERLKQIAEEGVTLLMGDSTNALQAGSTGEERAIAPTFAALFGRAEGRIILSMFASNVARVQLAIDATAASGRKLAITGRSMLAYIETAVKLGYLRVPAGLIVRVQDGVKDAQSVILTTGSQGEPNSGLWRMASGEHPAVKLKAGDMVVLSSSIISGNEARITELVDALLREGARVYQHGTRALEGLGILHTSGHANRDDLASLIKLLRPRYLMPVHGHYAMQLAHAAIGCANGVPEERIFRLNNGDVLELSAGGVRLAEPVESGAVYVDGLAGGRLGDGVIADRLALANEGMIMVHAAISLKTGKLLADPEVVSRGCVSRQDGEQLLRAIGAASGKLIARATTSAPERLSAGLREEIGNLVYRRVGRRPLVLATITRL